ncbi:MAG: NAD(P)H-hydrate dehydratase [bacterium]|nr:NAD(P)H-hydrate dehydratase [bacterium]
MMKRLKTSHKGDNGRVLVVGGNETYHGAPILAGLGAEKSGADLVNLIVPVNQQNLARQFSTNLIVDIFSGRSLRFRDVAKILDRAESSDVLVIGNGLGEKPQTLKALRKIIEQCPCHLVLDAAALLALAELKGFEAGKRIVVLTPHKGELDRMLEKSVSDLTQKQLQTLVQQKASEWHVTIVLKGPEDIIADPEGNLHINTTGHPVMTKGGTGDVLAGLIGGLMAQGMSGFEAAKEATKKWGEVGEFIAQKKGLMVTIGEMVENIP